MYKIKKMVDKIEDELDDAKRYAEHYVEEKASGNMERSEVYRSLAKDELRHASEIHQMAVEDIREISRVFVAPSEMQDAWDKSHRMYTEKSAWIKTMLSM